ncbi:MAG: DUF2892 domain-containing protein [Rhodobacter sp.]|nr:DUF2892 domain-containing protein [Rhodobacter sp.]
MFAKNFGSVDRILRIVLGIVLIDLFFMYPALGVWKWAAMVIGVVMLFTAFMSSCLIYTILGMRTNKS